MWNGLAQISTEGKEAIPHSAARFQPPPMLMTDRRAPVTDLA
ncbi:hypothetical protein A2U01_0056513 [Trifolium medium]|uniref:Uncharacterized protein n=1 Tax=Trifolium medium TaxID=97028 RepID=A0A392RGM1_9FABA|nr:hypothetical protein [Trifolium medium]